MATVIVGGALANKPLNGGEAWVRLTWTLGLRRLGHQVCLVEQIAPEHCIDGRGDQADFASSINRAYFERVACEFQHAAESFGIRGHHVHLVSERRDFGHIVGRRWGDGGRVSQRGKASRNRKGRRTQKAGYTDRVVIVATVACDSQLAGHEVPGNQDIARQDRAVF